MRNKEQQVPRCSEEKVSSMKYILNYKVILIDLMGVNGADNPIALEANLAVCLSPW